MPIALMSYLNPLLAPGLSQMAVSASEAGIDALIIPDLPPEESDELQAAARGAGLGTVFFAAPTSPNERIQRAAKASSGFLYVVGRVGVTGASTRWDGATMAYLDKIKDLVPSVPRAVGFGLSTPHDIQTVSAFADLAIVGSAFVATIAKAGSDAEAVRLAASFVQQINPISTL